MKIAITAFSSVAYWSCVCLSQFQSSIENLRLKHPRVFVQFISYHLFSSLLISHYHSFFRSSVKNPNLLCCPHFGCCAHSLFPLLTCCCCSVCHLAPVGPVFCCCFMFAGCCFLSLSPLHARSFWLCALLFLALLFTLPFLFSSLWLSRLLLRVCSLLFLFFSGFHPRRMQPLRCVDAM